MDMTSGPRFGGLAISATESSDSVLLSVRGEIDATSQGEFTEALKAAVLSRWRTVNLDLSKVEFMGSEGINILVRMRQFALDEGVALRLIRASRSVERLLEVSALSDYFQ